MFPRQQTAGSCESESVSTPAVFSRLFWPADTCSCCGSSTDGQQMAGKALGCWLFFVRLHMCGHNSRQPFVNRAPKSGSPRPHLMLSTSRYIGWLFASTHTKHPIHKNPDYRPEPEHRSTYRGVKHHLTGTGEKFSFVLHYFGRLWTPYVVTLNYTLLRCKKKKKKEKPSPKLKPHFYQEWHNWMGGQLLIVLSCLKYRSSHCRRWPIAVWEPCL